MFEVPYVKAETEIGEESKQAEAEGAELRAEQEETRENPLTELQISEEEEKKEDKSEAVSGAVYLAVLGR